MPEQVHFEKQNSLISRLSKSKRKYVVITDSHVESLYGKKLLQDLKMADCKAALLSFPPGESSKTRETKAVLEDQLLSYRLDKEGCIIALGGGVVSDIAGFIAATYFRGIPYVSVPTTLVGMVDASIGGKTGVNTKEGKNLIGAYHFPTFVSINTDYLQTLPPSEWKNGYAEIIKYGCIASHSLFQNLKYNRPMSTSLQSLIQECVTIKQHIVGDDPYEQKGKRAILNFGHTIGHAIESLSNYTISHGTAVGIGILIESALSVEKGFLSEEEYHEICEILADYRHPLPMTASEITAKVCFDKKVRGNQPRSVLLKTIGNPVSFNGDYCGPIEPREIERAYERLYR